MTSLTVSAGTGVRVIRRQDDTCPNRLKDGRVSTNSAWMRNSKCLIPLRCRFSQIYTDSGFRLRAGVANNDIRLAAGAPTSVPVRVAHELLLAGHRYLDVRTEEEYIAGHVPGSINIPYMVKVGSGMTKNPHFLEEVSAHFEKEDEILLGCQIGKRSLMAAVDLHSAGYTGVTDVAGGYAAWTQSDLPTTS